MSVELPPLPMLDLSRDALYGYTIKQLRAYATEALAAQSAELAECKEAYALLFKDNARLRAEVEKRKPLTDALIAALEDALCIFHPEPGDTHLAPKWEARATAALKNAKEQA